MSNETQAIIAGLIVFVALVFLGRYLGQKLRATRYSPETEKAIEELEEQKKRLLAEAANEQQGRP